MRLSDRVQSVQPSITLALDAQATQLKNQGVDVVNLSAGQPDFGTPEHICQAGKQAIDQGYTRYTPAGGSPELKQAVITKFQRDNNLTYTPEQVVINVGAKHGLYLLMQALVNPGDEVIVPAPYWVSYPPMVLLAGGVPVILPTRQEHGFKVQAADLVKAITPRTKAVILNSPSNPTGSAYTAAELRPVVDACTDAGIIIISDEIYETIVFDGREHVSIAGLSPAAYEHTVTVNGVSKAYAMTGWRIGYMGGPADVIKACQKIQSQSTSNPTSIAQKAAEAALLGDQSCLGVMRASFEKRRDYLMDLLAGVPGVKCPKPQGSFYAFPDLSAYFGKRFGDQEIKGSVDLAGYLLKETALVVVPGEAFGEDRCLRCSFCVSEDTLKKGVERLGEALGQLA